MSYEDYARKIAEKAEEARHAARIEQQRRERRRAQVLEAMRPLYDVARSHIPQDLKEHGLVEAIRRHEMRRGALDRAVSESL